MVVSLTALRPLGEIWSFYPSSTKNYLVADRALLIKLNKYLLYETYTCILIPMMVLQYSDIWYEAYTMMASIVTIVSHSLLPTIVIPW